MDSPNHRRRRKRFLKQSSSSASSPLCFSLPAWFRLIFYCLLSLISLLWFRTHLSFSSFHPVLRVPRLSLPSSSSKSAESFDDLDTFLSPLIIENMVLFPDYVLLLVSGGGGKKNSGDQLECVYGMGVLKDVVSFDKYDGFRWVVRCLVQNSNYSNFVGLKWRENGERLAEKENKTVNSWRYLVYTAVIDENDVVLFAKGLNLRRDRLSDPSFFTCHFELRNGNSKLAVKASMAAQELLRCPLPQTIISQGIISVTIGIRQNQARKTVLMPSVAAISISKHEPTIKKTKKHELCMCTMIWNQASSIKEWITYHSWLGVQRWFIYDNNSDDGIESVLEELDHMNYNITHHFWPWIKTQEAGFSHCALRARDECKWISFMDVDEYFYFPYSSSQPLRYRAPGYASQNSLLSLVENFTLTSIGEIRTSCYSFGPSGLNLQPEKGVTIGYTCRVRTPERHKSIIRPEALDSSLMNVVHHFHLKEGFKYYDLPRSGGVINHYKYQVWDVFRAKFYRRVATYVADWQENQNEGSRDRAPGLGTEAVEPRDWSRRFCEVWDTGLRDFVVANFADPSTGLLLWEKSFSA